MTGPALVFPQKGPGCVLRSSAEAGRRCACSARCGAELESVGIRLNRKPPNIYFRKKKTGGVQVGWRVCLVGLVFGLVGMVGTGAGVYEVVVM